MKQFFALTFAVLAFSTIGFSQNAFVATGNWRGVFPGYEGADIPFIFKISNNSSKEPVLYFYNGEEEYYGGKVTRSGDSLFVALDQFDNQLAFGINANHTLSGYLRKQNGMGTPLPVTAVKNTADRFPKKGIPPVADITARYDVVFTNDTGRQTKAVGLFKQQGSRIAGTFLRSTGDSRYSDGIIEGNQFYLSLFIGYSPLLFTGTVNADGSLTGYQIGLKSKLRFTAVKNSHAALPDPSNLTRLKQKDLPFNFALKNAAGKTITLNDDRYKNKPVIVTLSGTWCPNCADEANFLSGWYLKNKNRGIEIITIQFEVVDDFGYAQKVMPRFKKKYGIQYEQVFGGLADNAKVLEALPALDKFAGFPTTLFLDRNRKVVKIHTGFTGPATGKFYTDFIKEFNLDVDELLK